ncbi:MAG: putative ATP/GTP hydrolase [Parcubacteria group bacterium Athens1014_26]|nr:MAG: putative ATP/GTP hydrolase [Parcubacteria group bacterium Athens1014_26]
MISKSKIQTQKFAAGLAKKILKQPIKNTVVLALSGELGSGKTTFVQGFMKGLGVKHHITSPTFIIFRKHKIEGMCFGYVYHFDLYRIEKSKEIIDLGFKKIINPPTSEFKNLILIEWPEKIKNILPKDTMWIEFGHGKQINIRKINIKN